MKCKQRINEVHPSIKFDFNFSDKEIHFLDIVVYKTQSGIRPAYVHRKSGHLESLKRSTPFAQALRFRRICYDKLCRKLIERGYKQQEIKEAMERTKTLDIQNILEKRAKKQTAVHCLM